MTGDRRLTTSLRRNSCRRLATRPISRVHPRSTGAGWRIRNVPLVEVHARSLTACRPDHRCRRARSDIRRRRRSLPRGLTVMQRHRGCKRLKAARTSGEREPGRAVQSRGQRLQPPPRGARAPETSVHDRTPHRVSGCHEPVRSAPTAFVRPGPLSGRENHTRRSRRTDRNERLARGALPQYRRQ